MDCQMPIMDGYTACEKILKLYQNNFKLKIIALTADATIDNKNRCIKVGFNQVLHKPFRKGKIKEITSKLFH